MIDKRLAVVDASSLVCEGDAMGFTYTDPFGREAQGLMVFWKGALRAYRNLCPHWSVEIGYEGSFFDDSNTLLLCHHHGARFDPATGVCVFGPPQGQSLEVFDVKACEDAQGMVCVLRRVGLSFTF